MRGDDTEGLDSKIGFNVGALVGYNFSDVLGLQSGLLLNTRGAASEVSVLGTTMKSTVSIYELQLPVFLTAGFALNDKLKIKANVGPSFGFGLSAKTKITAGDESEEYNLYEKEEGDEESNLKRFNLGVAIGAGVELKKIYLGVGYDLGLTNISNGEGSDIKTGSFAVNVGFTF
jgi:hypothetical protein